jgi:MFS family permease
MTASVTLLVDKKDYTRAAGMQQTSAAIESIAAPIVAGLLLGVIGVVGVIVVDIATFLIGVVTLAIVHIPNAAKDQAHETEPLRGLKAALFGLSYIVKRKGLFAMLLYFALVNFSANMAAVLISPLVLSIGDSAGLGFVQMISGIGMLAGSLLLSISGGTERKMRMLYVAIFVSGLGLAATSLAPTLVVIAAGMFCMLFPIPFGNGAATAIWQTKVEPSVQGQVFAARGMISTIAMPLAFGLAGPLADRVFEPMMSSAVDAPRFFAAIVGTGAGRGYAVMLLLGGVMLVAATLLFAAYRPLRRVEEELPDVEIRSDDAEPAFASGPAVLAAASGSPDTTRDSEARIADGVGTGGPTPAQAPTGL